ncbi:MAG: DUF1638 domain-containing protein [Deltaproteobacteria bacterium]|jgi:hypothetical protein|nr:DUF1638 domain-containing protein [Deltaproteobacteria bacterium]
METILVACETIRDEIERACSELGLNHRVLWLDGGLHNSTERLRARARELFGEAEGNCDRLLVALGYCGGGLSGLSTGNYETILPLADDCLTFLLGSFEARMNASKPVTYFLTEGWLRHECGLLASYRKAASMFDRETASFLNHKMLDGYSRLGVLDTKSFDPEKVARMVSPMAIDLGLTVETLEVDRAWLRDFLTGPHDPGRFLILPPGSRLDLTLWNKIFYWPGDGGEGGHGGGG